MRCRSLACEPAGTKGEFVGHTPTSSPFVPGGRHAERAAAHAERSRPDRRLLSFPLVMQFNVAHHHEAGGKTAAPA